MKVCGASSSLCSFDYVCRLVQPQKRFDANYMATLNAHGTSIVSIK